MKRKSLIAVLSIIMILVLCLGVFAACNKNNTPPAATYTVLDSFQVSPTTWNPHQSRTTDDTYVSDYTYSGLYGFFFNEDKTGYEIRPEMAASEPVDVTTALKTESKWGIPASAERGYAYTIDLKEGVTWDDGTPINAQTYVESMKRLLSPDLLNYRASNQYSGAFELHGAKDYNKQNAPILESLITVGAGGASGYIDGENVIAEKNEAGEYVLVDGENRYPIVVSFNDACVFFDDTIGAYYDAGYDDYYLDGEGKDVYQALKAIANKYGQVAVTDEVIEMLTVIALNFGDENPLAWNEFCFYITGYGATYSWDNVGIYASGEYQITIVLNKSLAGFYLLYNLADPWIVNYELYDACLSQDAFGIWNNTYCTGVQAGTSCGPYKLTTYQEGKLMVFSRNDKWFGYSDGQHEGMYQATGIRSVYASEASTRKQMFLRGELDTYGLQAEDYATYRTSDFFYTSPGTTIFFLVLSSNETQLKIAEKDGVDKEIIANDKFREALSLTFDKDAFAAQISPARSGAYSVVGAYDIWNPTTGEKYRDTDIAKTALAEYYGFTKQPDGNWKDSNDVSYTLDEAVDAITGYDVVKAKELMQQAYDEQVAAGKIGPNDVVEIEFALSEANSFLDKTVAYLNEQIAAVTAGTSLEGRVSIVFSAPQGNGWSEALRSGKSQTQLCGWNGGMLDPFNSMLYYVEPSYSPYAEKWWDTTKETATITLPLEDGDVTLTMTLQQWGLALNGTAVEVGGTEYNFGYEQVADEVRLTILANMEKAILGTNYYIPMLQDGSGFLLTQKVNYALGPDDYNAVLGRGGIAYMTFNYSDAEWETYCQSQGGVLTY